MFIVCLFFFERAILLFNNPLKKTEFDAPNDVTVKQVNSTQALLKWSYKTSTLETIYRQLQLSYQIGVEIETDDLIKNMYFELYIIEKASNLSKTSRLMPRFPWLSSFRTLEAIDCALVEAQPAASSRTNQDIVFRAKSERRSRATNQKTVESIQFEYVLENLVPNTHYSMEMAVRLFNTESFASTPIRFTTTGKQTIK